METLLAKALESKLKYYLRSYTRDQFKLQGRTVQLSNLDLNGDVLHAIMGLPSTLRVSQARVGKLEITLPALANVKVEPTVVAISKLDLVLAETTDNEPPVATSNLLVKSTSYGFADKIADGMTVEVGVVNLMLETRGGSSSNGQDAASWTPPIANITIRNMNLYTTNENWEVVNLSETRQFFKGKKTIYIFRTLEWESLSIDLLPHPAMFTDDQVVGPGGLSRDKDGAKRTFLVGERFVDNIEGKAYITMHRTETNNPLGLEVDLKLSQAICPLLSEPGLRALMRFVAGMYTCMNRPDMKPMPSMASEAAGRVFLDVLIDHIFLRIKESDFQLELVLQSLHYVKGSVDEGNVVSAMSRLYLGNMFLRDTFSYPPVTLIQPGAPDALPRAEGIPPFASDLLWPRIYPLPTEEVSNGGSMLRLFSAHSKPAPEPPVLTGQLVVRCDPLKVTLQEESCFRIASLLSETHFAEPVAITVQSNSRPFYNLNFDEFDLIVPVPSKAFEDDTADEAQFTGARLKISKLSMMQDPFLQYKVLQVDRDAACYPMWEGQPVDASQRKYAISAEKINFTLETGSFDDSSDAYGESDEAGSELGCVSVSDSRIEMALLTADGSPLERIPPPGGIVRLALGCKELNVNSSRMQLLFVLKMYSYLTDVSHALVKVSKGKQEVDPVKGLSSAVTKVDKSGLAEAGSLAPGDSAVSVKIDGLRFRLLESIPGDPAVEGSTLAQFLGGGILLRVTHRSLGDAKTTVIQSQVFWQDISMECVETERATLSTENEEGSTPSPADGRETRMRPVCWKGEKPGSMAGTGGTSTLKKGIPFMDISVTHVIPDKAGDGSQTLSVSARIGGVRLGGGMGYNEALLHRFGVMEVDGTPGKDIIELVSLLRESGTLGSLLGTDESKDKTPSEGQTEIETGKTGVWNNSWEMSVPDEMDIDVQFLDWLFALEGAEGVQSEENGVTRREDRCWHSTFRVLRISAQNPGGANGQSSQSNSRPIQHVTMQMEGIQALKPRMLELSSSQNLGNEGDLRPSLRGSLQPSNSRSGHASLASKSGLDLKFTFVNNEVTDEDSQNGKGRDVWSVKSIVTAVQEPVEVEITKKDMENLVSLCKSEIASASRIAAGGLKLIQLQGIPIITQSTIDQLVNMGARAVTGEDFVKPEAPERDDSVWESTLRGLETEVASAQILCQELVKDLMNAWVRNPGSEDNLESLSLNEGEGEEEGGGEGEDEKVDLVRTELAMLEIRKEKEYEAARKVEELTDRLETLQALLEKAKNKSVKM